MYNNLGQMKVSSKQDFRQAFQPNGFVNISQSRVYYLVPPATVIT